MNFIIINYFLYYFSLLKKCDNDERRDEAIKVIITIARKYPSEVFEKDRMRSSSFNIQFSREYYSDKETMNVILLFKEMIKEGVINKGGYGSEIIEEIFYFGEMIKNTYGIILNKKEDIYNISDDFIEIAKEKGFGGAFFKEKYEILADFLITGWKEMCKEEVSII